MHPLKLVVLISWVALLASQISLYWQLESPVWSIAATLPILLPVTGFWKDHTYTYKWFAFVTLLYFCIGVSELFANPALQIYGLITLISSVALLFGSIYYIRFLARNR